MLSIWKKLMLRPKQQNLGYQKWYIKYFVFFLKYSKLSQYMFSFILYQKVCSKVHLLYLRYLVLQILLRFTTNLALNFRLLTRITRLKVCRAGLFILNSPDMYLLKIDSYRHIVKEGVVGKILDNNFNFLKTANMLFLILHFNPKQLVGRGGEGSIWHPPVVFWKMYLLKRGWNLGFLWLLILS